MATGKLKYVVVLWLVSSVLHRGRGLSLTVEDVECVYEEVRYDGDMISGNFVVVERFLFWKWSNPGIVFSVYDHLGTTLQTIKGSSGEKFEIFAPRRGMYKFCFHNRNSASEIISFYIHVGHIPKEEELAKDEHLDPLTVRIAMLKEALESVAAEQRYLRVRDARHRKTNKSTQRRVNAYTLAEYFALAFMSGIQIYFIRRMFRRSYA
ncbi:transmembrane emp24 domain-containing protein p24beta3-like [Tasmannia lanceolata]|uniref:transmembrane emp24 domain-containing protein p24beta3-like n=1 Tax=Tasmannia lanceolata TaxID=3420 RepID=UPI004062B85F